VDEHFPIRLLLFFFRSLLFFVGWITGGCLLSLLAMWIITSVVGSNSNTMFVGGTLWGTFGTLVGTWLCRLPGVRL
jgi:hypothetical protein